MNQGGKDCHHEQEKENVHGEQDPSPAMDHSAVNAANGSARSVPEKPTLFVHKLFGRLKTPNHEKNWHNPNATAQFVID